MQREGELSRQADWQTDKQTDRQADRQTCRRTDRNTTHRQKPTGRHKDTARQTDR